MPSTLNSDVVIVGTGVVGCLIAEQALDAGLSVLMLEAGPRVGRDTIVENYRNLPPTLRNHWNAPYPPKPWAPHLETRTPTEAASYLDLTGPNAKAYEQGYVRYAGGATWHWAGICWRMTPDDLRLKSLYGVGRDWAFSYDVLEPYYARAEYAMGVCGPGDPALQWPPRTARSRPYPMGPIPFGPGEQRLTDVAATIGMQNLPAPQARNSGVSFDGRPRAAETITAFQSARSPQNTMRQLPCPASRQKGGRIITNAVAYRIETNAQKKVEAVHYYDPNRTSHSVSGKIFVLACNGIETPKLLLLSADDKNPRGVANSSDQVGRNMMDQPKLIADIEMSEPLWTGVGPVQSSSIMNTSQGDFRREYAGAMFRMENMARSTLGGLAALEKGLYGKALDQEIRRLSACTARLTVEHEPLPLPFNRLTLSDKKDWLGLNRPSIYYDVGDYVRRSAENYTVPLLKKLATALGATNINISPEFLHSDHIMGGTIMGNDPSDSVVDADCRAHDHDNLFLPGGGAMTTGGSGNSTITMAALALKAADAIVGQLNHA